MMKKGRFRPCGRSQPDRRRRGPACWNQVLKTLSRRHHEQSVRLLVCAWALVESARRLQRRQVGRQQSGNASRAPRAASRRPQSDQRRPASRGGGRAAAPKRPWGAMLGGLAAGLGLAWLASRWAWALPSATPADRPAVLAAVVSGASARARNGSAARPLRLPGRGAARRRARAVQPGQRAATTPRPGRGSATAAFDAGEQVRLRPARRAARLIGSAPGRLAVWGIRRLRRRGFLARQAQLRHPAGRLGPRRHRPCAR